MTTDDLEAPAGAGTARLHLRAGYLGLAAFVALGAALEAFHAYKSAFYLDAGHETTRLLLRLGHAHGTLLSLVQLAYGLTVHARPSADGRVASALLLASLALVPLGFLLGGAFARGADPGAGILLVPPGAVALAVGLVLVARKL